MCAVPLMGSVVAMLPDTTFVMDVLCVDVTS